MQTRRTKIIATIGPATDSQPMIEKLIRAGMNVARLNMTHASHEQARVTVESIRRTAHRLDRVVGILMDTQGPAIRTGDLPNELTLRRGDTIALTVRGAQSTVHPSVSVNYDDLVDDVGVGDTVVVDNGNIKLKVLAKSENQLVCRVLTDATLGSRRHINLPGVRVNLPALTDKDIADIVLGIELGVDFFAMSFVRRAGDVRRLRALLQQRQAPQQIIAKLEEQEGVSNLDEIIEAADAIMIARGDLGIEIPYEDLPPLQRRIVKTALRRGRPVIVATHMLESMVANPLPTRAEVTDVANAVFEQADAMMLSGETSIGRYPVECVQVMDRIARRIERSGGAGYSRDVQPDTVRAKLVRAAADLAAAVEAHAIVVFTHTGRMARNAAWARPHGTEVFAFTDKPALLGQLSLLWGAQPVLMGFSDDPNQTVADAAKRLVSDKWAEPGCRVLYIAEARIRGKRLETIQLELL